MKKKLSTLLALLLAALIVLPWGALAGDGMIRWRVNISYDLNGGRWLAGRAIQPRSITAKPWESMPHSALEKERSTIPIRGSDAFLGWSVLFTDPQDGRVIYDSGDETWNLDKPFDYYPDNPLTMNCKMTARWRAAARPKSDIWKVYVSHDLNGGSWPDGQEISPHTLTARNGKPMPADGLDAEKIVRPYMAESVFLGWSVLFTDPADGRIIHDGRSYIWDLDHPFDYYPDNPSVMDCLMIANWGSSQTGGGSSLPQEILPDGRVLTRPFAVGTEPLPETPPPCDRIIPGTAWLTNALICAIDEGMKVPVYSFPAANGPIIDWIGLDADVEYGLYLPDNWAMLYHPKWVEAAGIGFVDASVVAFPGCEE